MFSTPVVSLVNIDDSSHENSIMIFQTRGLFYLGIKLFY